MPCHIHYRFFVSSLSHCDASVVTICRAKAGNISVPSPNITVEWWTHPTVGRGKRLVQQVSALRRPTIRTSEQMGHRIVNNNIQSLNTQLTVVDKVKVAFFVSSLGACPCICASPADVMWCMICDGLQTLRTLSARS